MTRKELMIGDWVSLFQGNPDGTNCNVQVSYIGEYGEVGIEGCEEYTSANCNLLFPIPLTPEILEKNGFHKSMPYNDWTNDNVNLILTEYAYGYNVQNTSIVLDYVHELQHAMRLCGIEKEIEI